MKFRSPFEQGHDQQREIVGVGGRQSHFELEEGIEDSTKGLGTELGKINIDQKSVRRIDCRQLEEDTVCGEFFASFEVIDIGDLMIYSAFWLTP